MRENDLLEQYCSKGIFDSRKPYEDSTDSIVVIAKVLQFTIY